MQNRLFEKIKAHPLVYSIGACFSALAIFVGFIVDTSTLVSWIGPTAKPQTFQPNPILTISELREVRRLEEWKTRLNEYQVLTKDQYNVTKFGFLEDMLNDISEWSYSPALSDAHAKSERIRERAKTALQFLKDLENQKIDHKTFLMSLVELNIIIHDIHAEETEPVDRANE